MPARTPQRPTHAQRSLPLLRRLRAPVVVGLLLAALAVSVVAAATPVTDGYRGIAYGGGATRPSSDKPQSKLWFTDGTWYAGMFRYKVSPGPISSHRIFRLNHATLVWVDTTTVVDERDNSHGDYLWVEGTQTLYVASAGAASTTGGASIIFSRYTYNSTTNAYTRVAGVAVPGTETGAHTVSIARDSSGRLWTAWPSGTQVLFSTSSDDGTTWTTPAQVPVQAANPIRGGTINQTDTASVVAFGTNVGIGWSDHDTTGEGGFYFAVIAAGADPAVEGSWTLEELPTLVGTAGERADNHLNLKATSDGTVYAVGKTGKDTASCATNRTQPLVEAFRRTTAGAWNVRLVATVGDCVSRPQIVLSEQLGVAWVLMTSPNGGGAIYTKSAPLTGADALVFRGPADTTSQPGVPFIRSATETRIDDATTTKQALTSTTGLVALANNVPSSTGGGGKYYLHNERAIPAADTTPPAGTVTIAAGAAFTATATVSVAVPASDAGSGLSLVRLSNTAAVDGDGVLSAGTSFSQASPISWTLAAGDGTKTVYAQWRDASGNWSDPVSDTIGLDTTAPSGTVTINGGAATATSNPVTLSLTTDDGSGSGTSSVLVSTTGDFTGVAPIPYAPSIQYTLTGPNGTKTVHVKFVDAVGNVTATAVTDSIVLDVTDTIAPSKPGAPVHRLGGTVGGSIPVRLSWTGGSDAQSGIQGWIVQRSTNGGSYVTIGTAPLRAFNVALRSSTTYRFRIATLDHAGNRSAFVYGASFRTGSASESSSSVRYTGTWSTPTSTSYLGGKANFAKVRCVSETFRFTGKQFAWVGLTGPTSGKARVYVNGTYVKTVDLYAATTGYRKIVYTRTWSTSATRSIRIVVAGTTGRPRVTVDSFFIIR